MPHLLVVLQTHSKGDSQHYLKMHDMKRYCGADKPEVLRRCTQSLIESINYAKETLSEFEVELQVFDDHSDEQSIGYLKKNLGMANFPTKLEHLETKGIMPSILKCYEHGRDYGKQWVYFVQDDYLYEEKAIRDMMLAIHEFSRNLNAPASIYPFNDPFKYEPSNVVLQSHIVRSQGRHWRTLIHTASCFMTHIDIIRKEWDLFEKMGKDVVHGKMEEESINRLFYQRGYNLFVPIPSLALHMQYSTEEDKLINWREWWDKYNTSDKVEVDQNVPTVLNVGFGGQTIHQAHMSEEFHGHRQYSLDINKKLNPDIVGTATDMSMIRDNQFDAVYNSHIIEHLDFYDVTKAIKEFLRVLKPGGLIKMITPNLKSIAAKIADGGLLDTVYLSPAGPITALDMLYGHRASVLHGGTDFMRHKTGFTKESFEKILLDAGIEEFKVEECGFDLVVYITKTIALEKAA